MVFNKRCLAKAPRFGHQAPLAVVVFFAIILCGCQSSQLSRLRDGIRQADDGLTAAKAGLDAALPNLPVDHVAHGPLSRAKPFIDKAQPVVHELREQVDQASDLPGLIRGLGQGYRNLGLPYAEIVGGGASVLATFLGLFWRRDRERAKKIVRAIELAKDETGIVDFSNHATARKLDSSMGPGAKALVDAALR